MRLLLVEDKDSFRRLLVQALADTPWEVAAFGDPLDAIHALQASSYDVLVTDLRLPSLSGLELIQRAKRLQPALRVVLMSAFGEPKDIVEAMRLGADDFLPKPFDLDIFTALLDRLRALVGAPPPDPAEPWVVRSPAMRVLDENLNAAADLDTPALFTGERATGRARAARRLHILRTPKGPFLRLPATELGPEGPDGRTIRLLKGGSILITGLERLSTTSSAALASVMDAPGGRDLRWLATCTAENELQGSLAARFGALVFHLPSLVARPEDVVPIFSAMLRSAARREGIPEPLVERGAERELAARAWRGNFKELQACAEKSLKCLEGAVLRRLPEASRAGPPLEIPWPLPADLESMLRSVDRAAVPALLQRAMESQGGDLARAAASLGLTVRVLASRLREHGISLEDRGP